MFVVKHLPERSEAPIGFTLRRWVYTIPNPKYIMLYVGRVNYVVSLVSLTSLLDRRSEDLGEETTGLQVMSEYTTNTTSSASP